MKLSIPFDDIKEAIELASSEHHYLIDKKNQCIVFISDYENDYEKKLEETDNDNFIAFQPRMPQDDINIMQSFAYGLSDFNLAQEFDRSLKGRKPFLNFKALLELHPELREQWLAHRDKEITDEAMDFLFEHDIELEDKSFMPVIEIREVKPGDVKLPDGWDTFGPVACLKCDNKKGIRTRYFELNTSPENMLIDKEIKKIMLERYGVENYGHIGGGERDILTISECPKCKSTDIFEDF